VSNIVAELSKIVGDGRVLTGDAVAERATSYWNSAPMQAAAIVLPRSTGDVSAILKCCHEHEQTVVTHGGLTNCVAAAESAADDVVISLEKMNGIVEIDKVGGTAVVEAGAILQYVQEAAAEQGLRFPLDLGARGSCTIGGNVATNAGGMNVLRYGMMRNLVLGLEAVLADGTVVSSMNRMMKNNAGYDVKQLFIGTEGTLGIVTRVVLRLFPRPVSQQSALVAMESFTSVATFLSRLQQKLAASLSAFEIMCGDYYAAVTADGGHRAPLSRDYPFYVVFESEGTDPDADTIRFENVLEQTLGDGLIVDAILSTPSSRSPMPRTEISGIFVRSSTRYSNSNRCISTISACRFAILQTILARLRQTSQSAGRTVDAIRSVTLQTATCTCLLRLTSQAIFIAKVTSTFTSHWLRWEARYPPSMVLVRRR